MYRGCWRMWQVLGFLRGWAWRGSRRRERGSRMLSNGEEAEHGGTAEAIRVERLGKCYHMYEQPRDRFKQLFSRVTRKNYFREFWALQDVSFSVKRGETVGVIGPNGSGKSTLLQMICGTLTKTTGSLDVRGRLAALLELGAGFNPEFT